MWYLTRKLTSTFLLFRLVASLVKPMTCGNSKDCNYCAFAAVKLVIAFPGILIFVVYHLTVENVPSDGRVVRASAFGAVDSGLIPSWVKPMFLKLVFAVSLRDAQH